MRKESNMKAPNSIEDVTKSYKDNPPTGITEEVRADNTEGRHRKTLISCACEGPQGYLGTIMLDELNPGGYRARVIAGREWHVTRYQFNWFEWFPNDPNPKALSGSLSEAKPGRFFRVFGIKWGPGGSFTAHEEVEDVAM
jgi:hypothetical protein